MPGQKTDLFRCFLALGNITGKTGHGANAALRIRQRRQFIFKVAELAIGAALAALLANRLAAVNNLAVPG